jgi:glycosyltransferase involved in cell wall biosynthesis
MVGGRKSAYLHYLEVQLQKAQLPETKIVEECEDVLDFFRLSDVFVCASFQESFPQVVLLAMAFKLGIVSTNVFGVTEMISHGYEGLLVEPGDVSALASGILSLVRDHSRRKELGARAHSKATRLFNKKIQLPKHLALTKEVVARHL